MESHELLERQKWTLDQKIDHTFGVIDQYYNKLNGRVYVSFSGGKDSTVLLWLTRQIFPDVRACFCNTRNEYPSIVQFVRRIKEEWGGVDIIYPELTPKEVIAKYGFPVISKQTAAQINTCKHRSESVSAERVLNTSDTKYRLPFIYRGLIGKEYDISNKCCLYLKEKPLHEYALENKLSPIVGTMASESILRTSAYLKAGGCNTFNNRDKRKQVSRPLSIWNDEDVLVCIDKYNIPIATIYDDLKRTGCMFCGFGCTISGDHRFEYLLRKYPKMYNAFMNYTNNGITYRQCLKDVLSLKKMSLPDDNDELTLF